MLNKKLSIIIVNYKSNQFLFGCLTSIWAAFPSKEAMEIIVVNNDVVDISHIKKEFSEIKIIDHRKNIGFGAAANLGVEVAQGENLLFLNPDSEIISDNCEDVLAHFEKESEVAAIGSRIISEKGTTQEWIAGKDTGLMDLIRNNFNRPVSRDLWESQVPLVVDWVSGAALFVRKEIFQSVGGFDENFFMYFEDMDLCRRLRKAGQKIFYYPSFCVKHLGGQSYADKTAQKRDYYRSQEYYFKKHRNRWEFWLIKILRKIFFK